MVGDFDIYCDGWRVREDRGYRSRINVVHVQRCITAIRQRWDRESQHDVVVDNVVRLTHKRKCATVNT